MLVPKDTLRSQFRGLPIALFVGVSFLVSLGFLLVKVPDHKPTAPASLPSSNVALVNLDGANADAVLRQEAQLRDPAPLFLPTAWNASYAVHASRIHIRPPDTFESYPSKLVFLGGESPITLPAPQRLPESPAKALDALQSDKPFIGLSTRLSKLPSLGARSACVELHEANTGVAVAKLEFTDLNIPATALWMPAEFMACVRPSGLLGEPALVSGSGVESVDHTLAKALVEHWPELQKRARLAPGVYRILFGP